MYWLSDWGPCIWWFRQLHRWRYDWSEGGWVYKLIDVVLYNIFVISALWICQGLNSWKSHATETVLDDVVHSILQSFHLAYIILESGLWFTIITIFLAYSWHIDFLLWNASLVQYYSFTRPELCLDIQAMLLRHFMFEDWRPSVSSKHWKETILI